MVISDRLYTLAEFDQISAAHPERLLELINGRIVEKVVGWEHGRYAANIIFAVKLWYKQHGIAGHYGVEVQHVVDAGIPFKPLPDVSFAYGGERTPGSIVKGMPDFVAEVKSPGNTYAELREKARLYMQYGTRLVWLVFPVPREVEVYQANGTVTTFNDDQQVLSGGDVLPDFSMRVAEVFE